MRELDVHLEVQRRQARRAAGLNPRGFSIYPVQTATAAYEADLLALPEAVDEAGAIMDPATGAFTFMLGFSVLGGPDTLG